MAGSAPHRSLPRRLCALPANGGPSRRIGCCARPTRKLGPSERQCDLAQRGRTMIRAAIAKPRRSDCASVAFWRAVGVQADCSRMAGSEHQAEERGRPIALRQDKSREVRPGRAVEELNQINHFARRAFRHRTSSLCTSYWKIETTHTSRTATWSRGPADRSVAPRTFRPFCPGRAPWHTARWSTPVAFGIGRAFDVSRRHS